MVPEQESGLKAPAKPKRRNLIQWALVAVLAALVAIAALPSYFGGQWPWNAALQVPQISQVRALKDNPLDLPGWQMTAHQEIRLSGTPWSLAEYQLEDRGANQVTSFALLLRPQTGHNRQPEVEWVDISGSQSWQINDLHRLTFSVPTQAGDAATVKARYFRGLTDDETLAVMQWYAWPAGGDPAPGRWFWADQASQWRQQERLAWVAVSVLFTIEPVGDIRPYTDEAIAIGQSIQTSLMNAVFSRTS